jgi:HD-like signal output (HDOD) protein
MTEQLKIRMANEKQQKIKNGRRALPEKSRTCLKIDQRAGRANHSNRRAACKKKNLRRGSEEVER